MWISIVLIIPGILAQDIFFPYVPPIPRDITAPEQKDIHCSSNMRFDHSQNECVCVPETVYYPPKDSCFNAFEQGPCEPGHYLAIPKDANVAECVVNTCGDNGTVPYKNSCYFLLTSGPCKSTETLRISKNSLELECREINIESYHFIDSSVESFAKEPGEISCPPGREKINTGECRPSV